MNLSADNIQICIDPIEKMMKSDSCVCFAKAIENTGIIYQSFFVFVKLNGEIVLSTRFAAHLYGPYVGNYYEYLNKIIKHALKLNCDIFYDDKMTTIEKAFDKDRKSYSFYSLYYRYNSVEIPGILDKVCDAIDLFKSTTELDDYLE